MDFLKTGGLGYTFPILLMGLANLVLFIWLGSQKLKKVDFNKKHLDLIMFLGGFSLIFGMFGQVVGMYSAAGAIQTAGDISPALIWGGFKVSMIAPIMGFVVLLVSSIMWFILRPGKRVSE